MLMLRFEQASKRGSSWRQRWTPVSGLSGLSDSGRSGSGRAQSGEWQQVVWLLDLRVYYIQTRSAKVARE